MSARSSLLSLALVACGHHAPAAPEADPAKVAALAAQLLDHMPVPVAVRACKPGELAAPVTVTFRTLRQLGGQIPGVEPEQAEWINPQALDTPAARAVLDAPDATAKRQAAATLLAAPAWIVYRIDLVNAPMALGVKELKTGTVGTRIIRYDRASTQPTCVTVFNFQNTPDKTAWAISVSNKAFIDAAVAKVLRDDLVAQYQKLLPRG
ncbi:MAG: hypothetical protein ABI678_26775 [Kofleriaceae bacterium]